MNRLASLSLIAVAGTLVGSLALAQNTRDTKPAAPPSGTKPAPAAPPEMPLPPGWTAEDMEACMAAGQPGEMHEHLANSIGVWKTKNTMWMGPGAPPMQSEGTMVVSGFMDGRYIRSEMSGEMPGMGVFNGYALYGFDNVSQKFQAVWVDNHSTGMAVGNGELSSDGKTMSWAFTFNCPVTKKPTILREVERITGPDARALEMFGTDPKSGQEYKMMEMTMTRVSKDPTMKPVGTTAPANAPKAPGTTR